MASLLVTTDIRSLSSTLQELRYLDREMYKGTEKALKKVAEPLVRDVRQAFPDKALSGMMVQHKTSRRKQGPYPVYKRGAVRRQVSAKVGGRRRTGEGSFPVLKITQRNGAAMIYDMAQQQETPGSTLSANLINKFGNASRTMWPTVRKNIHKIEGAVIIELEKAGQKVAQLNAGGASRYQAHSARASSQLRNALGRFGA
jgi:hypothetical protein